MMYVPVLLSVAIVEESELFCVIGGVLICFCFHVVADVSMVSTVRVRTSSFYRTYCIFCRIYITQHL